MYLDYSDDFGSDAALVTHAVAAAMRTENHARGRAKGLFFYVKQLLYWHRDANKTPKHVAGVLGASRKSNS